MPFRTLKKWVGDEIDDRLKDVFGGGDDDFGDARPPGGFSFDETTYPYDLFTNEEHGGNYAVFYISVAEDSRIFSAQSQWSSDPISRKRGDISGAGVSEDSILVTQGILGGIFGTAIGAIFGAGVSGGLAGGVLAAGSAKVVEAQGVSFSRKQNTLKEAIALHVPNELQVQYVTDWGEEELFGLKMAEGVANNVIDAANAGSFSGAIDSLKNGSLGAQAGAGVLRANSGLGAQVGLAANPRKEQIFTGVQARTFNLNYKFYPRNRKEANNVQKIIDTFKIHMMPEFLDEDSYIYIYPSEFDIRYMKYNPETGVSENTNIFRHASCVLTDMSVNYTPNGKFSTNEDGTPTACDLTLTFKELAILDRKSVMEDGY